MQIAQENATASASLGSGASEASHAPRTPYSDYKIIRRNGVVRVICKDPRHKQRQG